MRVLIVEDQKKIASFIRKALQAEGFAVDVMHSGESVFPAVEAQASDRAHRIGQDKSVFVYKLICSGTVEEKIMALQTRKAELATAVLEGGSTQSLRFDEEDLAELFAPL